MSDYLYGTEYEIEQPAGIFHHNSDTEILGRFMQVLHKDTVLDIGCGSGSLLLYAAMHQPLSLTGIDIDEKIVTCAEENLKRNHIEGKIFLTKVQEYHPDQQYTCILCNPPYFKDQMINDNTFKAQARHMLSLSTSELFASVKRLLKDNGTFYMVHRAAQMNEIIVYAHEYGMHAQRIRIAYDTINGRAKSVLFAFKKRKAMDCVIEKPYFLDQRDSF